MIELATLSRNRVREIWKRLPAAKEHFMLEKREERSSTCKGKKIKYYFYSRPAIYRASSSRPAAPASRCEALWQSGVRMHDENGRIQCETEKILTYC